MAVDALIDIDGSGDPHLDNRKIRQMPFGISRLRLEVGLGTPISIRMLPPQHGPQA